MYRASSSVVVLALLALLPATGQAQDPADPATDMRAEWTGLSLSVMSGELSGSENLSAETEIGSGSGVGGALTYWFHPWVGIRAKGIRTDQNILTTNHPDLRRRIQQSSGNVWFFGGDLLLRRPFAAGDVTLLPYLSLGFGVKQYDMEDPFTDRALNGGAGLEVRMGPVGVFGEVTAVGSQFDEAGWRETAGEWLYVGGISVHQSGW